MLASPVDAADERRAWLVAWAKQSALGQRPGLWLALDSAEGEASVALLQGGHAPRLVTETLPAQSVPSERLMPAIDRLLQEVGGSAEALSGIVVGLGPGSFTGLRVGLATAKGLALGASVPLFGTSSFALKAAPHRGRTTLVVRDARRHEVYFGCYQTAPDGLQTTCVTPPVVLPMADLTKAVEGVLATTAKLGAATPLWSGDVPLPSTLHSAVEVAPPGGPLAAYGLVLEAARLACGRGDEPAELAPLYLQTMPHPAVLPGIG